MVIGIYIAFNGHRVNDLFAQRAYVHNTHVLM